MYSKQVGTITADDGTEFEMTVCHVDISPEDAERLFDEGTPTGDWGWKRQRWICRDIQHLEEIRAAARYYYGWDEYNEAVRPLSNGKFEFEAYYCC